MHATYNQTLGKFSFIAQAVLPERMQCRYLQQQQIQAVLKQILLGAVCQGTTIRELGHIRKGQNVSMYWSSLQ